jgi:hypothetical protein
MKIFGLITCSLFPLMALLALPSNGAAEGSVPLGCGCSKQDTTDLESRVKQVEAAIKEYDALINEWDAKEKNTKEPLLLTRENRGGVQGSVGFRMSTVRAANARSFWAETDATCATSFDPAATPCLRGALQDHESVHKKACDANKSANPFVDWRDKQRVVDYMKEEQAGYHKELDRLNDELNKMKKFCSLDPSTRVLLEQAAAQKQRLEDASTRVEKYAKTLR